MLERSGLHLKGDAMKNKKVTLVPLEKDDREQFILDNQWAFKYGAMLEFGMRDDHLDNDNEIISRKTIEESLDAVGSEALFLLKHIARG